MTRPVGYLTNSLTGLEGEKGVFYNYIMAGNGLFIQARNSRLAATVCIAPQEVRGLAPLEENIQLLHGKIPLPFLNLALSLLCIKPEIEQYLALIWQDNYSLRVPKQSHTAGSVTYDTLPDTVMDIHSHVQGVPAHFSETDNHDEQGLGLYTVVADLRSLIPTVEIRLGVYGYFIPIDKSEVFQ